MCRKEIQCCPNTKLVQGNKDKRLSNDRFSSQSLTLQMKRLIVRFTVLPHSPKNRKPAVGQATQGMTLRDTPRADFLVIQVGPNGLVEAGFCPSDCNRTELSVTTQAEVNRLAFTASPGDWAGASQSLQAACRRKALTVVAELGQQSWFEKTASARQ